MKITEDQRKRIVTLRTSQRKTLNEISLIVGVNTVKVSEVLKKELGVDYEKYKCCRTRYYKEEIQAIVKLRLAHHTLPEISAFMKINRNALANILRKELGNEYVRYRKIIPEEKKKKAILLRKAGATIDGVSQSLNIGRNTLTKIFREEFKDEYDNYRARHVTPKMLQKMIFLRKQKKSLSEIASETGYTEGTVKRTLRSSLGDEYNEYVCESTKETVFYDLPKAINKFEESFDNIFIQLEELRTNKYLREKKQKQIERGAKKASEVKGECFAKFEVIWRSAFLSPWYKNPIKIGGVIICLSCKIRGVPINPNRVKKITGLKSKQFNHLFNRIVGFFPQYESRDRISYVRAIIQEVKEYFKLSKEYTNACEKIIQSYWQILKNTTDEVIAGTVGVLGLFSLPEIPMTIHDLCRFLGIEMSSIQYQLKEKLCKKLFVEGFTSLLDSENVIRAELLAKAMS